MLRPEAIFASPAIPPVPQGIAPAGDAAPSAEFRTLHEEIVRYVRDGEDAGLDPMAGGAATTLSAEARALLQRTGGDAGKTDDGADAEQRRLFVEQVAPLAREAGARLGVAPEILTAQAALESGWGQRPLRAADGSDSHNLFGIKAGAGYGGARIAAATTEVSAQGAYATVESFRRYDSAAESFRDVTRLLQSPRYRAVQGTGADVAAYAAGLVQGGYATDPRYADKLQAVVRSLPRP
ncbi:glycoside hydrolase family 73 protein [Rubrivivax sp. JA1026]|uniref:glycoside hydrolase family 73 protein n=1 Tax=Rubrivivax sp. JA1026 TaxID=2710888 RepID=UPI0013E96402|nr:glucosaminidase domain-containing protein [Rubrivivax sp. JA1026]